MEEEACERRQGGDTKRRSVEPVAEDGVSNTREMYAYLVRAAGSDANAQVGANRKLLKDLVFGERRPAGRKPGCHPSPPDGIASDGRCHGAGLGFHPAVNEGQVYFFDLPALELRGQSLVGEVRAGDHQNAARFFIEAMHDARTQIAADGGQRPEVVKQCVDQRSRMMTRSGMDHHSRRFIYDNNILIFVEDV